MITPATATFIDVPTSDTFFSYIETAAAHGLVNGYGAAQPGQVEFRPGNEVTRGQLSKIIVNAENWALINPTTATFVDVPVGSTFFTQVETAVAHNIISGYDTDHGREFRPGNSSTRAQIAKIVYLAVTSAQSEKQANSSRKLKK